MKVKEIMLPLNVKIKADISLKEANRLLIRHHLNGLPIVDDENKLVGVITHADIFRAILPTYDELHGDNRLLLDFEMIEKRADEAQKRKVKDYMSSPPISIDEETPVIKAGSLLLLKKIKQIPITREGKLVGIVTFTDLLDVLMR